MKKGASRRLYRGRVAGTAAPLARPSHGRRAGRPPRGGHGEGVRVAAAAAVRRATGGQRHRGRGSAGGSLVADGRVGPSASSRAAAVRPGWTAKLLTGTSNLSQNRARGGSSNEVHCAGRSAGLPGGARRGAHPPWRPPWFRPRPRCRPFPSPFSPQPPSPVPPARVPRVLSSAFPIKTRGAVGPPAPCRPARHWRACTRPRERRADRQAPTNAVDVNWRIERLPVETSPSTPLHRGHTLPADRHNRLWSAGRPCRARPVGRRRCARSDGSPAAQGPPARRRLRRPSRGGRCSCRDDRHGSGRRGG